MAGRELEYPRNDVLLRAFRRLGDVTVLGESGRGSILSRSLRVTLKAILHLRSSDYDLVFVGFYGHLLMLPVGGLSKSPVLFDAFISTFDTLCFDRRVISPTSPGGRLSFWLDKTACQRADHVLLDTRQHVDYFTRTFGLPGDLLGELPVGCNEEIFFPHEKAPSEDTSIVLFYSTYLGLHGVDTILKAAARLRSNDLVFKLIGRGFQYKNMRRLAERLDLRNVKFLPYLPLVELANEIATARICLGGPFGSTEKASRVVPGKIFQMLAMARPVIAAASPANLEFLVHGENAYLCRPNDPEDLANAILQLHENRQLRMQLATAGRETYEKHMSEAVITDRLEILCKELGVLE